MAITPFLKLYKPASNEIGWDDEMNANLDTIDNYISEFLNIPGFSGTWANAHAYSVGQVVLDTVAGLFYECKVSHTSAAAPTTFAADRTAHPTFWVVGTNHAQDSATAAANSASAAATSAASSLSSLNAFKQTYYGSAATDPLVDPLGQARTAGDLYFNTTTQRLRVFSATPTAGWIEITSTFADSPTTPVGAVFLRSAAHAWVEGVAKTGGVFTGDTGVNTRFSVGTAIPAPAFNGHTFAATTVALRHSSNLYLSTTAPSPPTGGWRYAQSTASGGGALLIASDTVGGFKRTFIYTTPTNEVGVADGVATLLPMIGLSSGPAGLNSPLFTVFGTAEKPGGGTWGASSDARIKNIIGPYPHGLDELLEMLPQMFTYKGNDYSVGADGQPDQQLHPDTTTQYIGLIGQECEEYMPELVTETTAFIDGVLQTDVRQVDGTGVIYALVNAVATLDARTMAGAPVLGNSLSNNLTMLPSSPTTVSRIYYNSQPALGHNNSMGATGVDGTTLQGCAVSIESHNGVGFQTAIAGQRIPPHMNGVILAPRSGDVFMTGRIQARSTVLNDLHIFGLLRIARVSATEEQITTALNSGYPTITSIATGGTGVSVNDRFYDTLGNTYTCTAVSAGAATTLQLDATTLITAAPANPYALTAAPGGTATGVSVNLARNILTQLTITSPGDLYLEAPNTFSARVRADPTIPLGIATKQYSDNKDYFVSKSGAAAPTTAQVTAGQAAVWKNTTDASVRLYYNDAGTMKSVALT